MMSSLRHKYQKEIDRLFRAQDHRHIKQIKNLLLIPELDNRFGGKKSYAEWAFVTGLFQTLFYQILKEPGNNLILDIGCGHGIVGIAAEPFVKGNGKYLGLDIKKDAIEFCRSHYPVETHEFIHFDAYNEIYASDQKKELSPWPIESNSQDIVSALSVWTHLRETDAIFYLQEVKRVLKPGARAIITMFLKDEKQDQDMQNKNSDIGKFHNTSKSLWRFDVPITGSDHWFTTSWSKAPEQAIAIDHRGLEILLQKTGLRILEKYDGNWKENPGMYFQDIVILEKS